MFIKSFKLLLVCLFLIFGAFFISPYITKAATSSSVFVEVAPPSPAPFEDTTITLNSYAYNLDSVMIVWSINGQNILSGVGKKSFSFKAPAAGAQDFIVATISFPDGALERQILIKPAVMVLLWQATDSYVPPFYKGKAMPMPASEIKVVAMPEIRNSSGSLIDSQNMTYDWKMDYTNNADGSGYGKNYFIYNNDYLENSNNISVTASTTDGQSSSQANLDIGSTDSKISFYKKDKDLGIIWEHALDDNHRIVDSEIVVAIPYFISPKILQTPTLVFNWSINDSPINVPFYKKNVVPLKVQEGTSGTSKLHLDIENQSRIFQSTSRDINIQF